MRMITSERAGRPHSPLIGLAPLMRMAFAGHPLTDIGSALLARAADPADAAALIDCSTVLLLNGQRDLAMALQAQALARCRHYRFERLPAPGDLRVLVVMGPGDLMANTPVEFLVEQSAVHLELWFVSADCPLPPFDTLPAHDVLLVAVAESAPNADLLRALHARLAGWPAPVLNRPHLIGALSRDQVSRTLSGIAGLAMPPTLVVERADLQRLDAGAFDDGELILRPLGSHAGQQLERIANLVDLYGYLARVPAARFYLSRFVDYGDDTGQFRKFRIALIDGVPFICHYAVSSHWMVHYLNAGMDGDPSKRRQEAAAMADFDKGFARRHSAALAAITARIGLPYFGIDCAETRSGELLVFEADNAMIVHAMDDPARYPYKIPAMQKVFAAFEAMLRSYAATPRPGPGSAA